MMQRAFLLLAGPFFAAIAAVWIFPKSEFARLSFFLVMIVACALLAVRYGRFIYVAAHQEAIARGGPVAFDRATKPFFFWAYVTFSVLIAALALAGGAMFLAAAYRLLLSQI